MGYQVAHFRKVKTSAGLENVANHNSRGKVIDDTGGWTEGKPPEWMKHPERIDKNEGPMGHREILKSWNRAVEEAELGRKPQKNAAFAIEAVFSASPDAFKTYGEWKRYFEDCRELVDRRFGHENVLQWNAHYDEKTPHMHMLLIPIVRDPDKKNKYSSSEFLGGPNGLREFQDQLFENVGKKYGLSRGEAGSDARHTDQAQLKRDLQKKKEALDERERTLTEFMKIYDEREAGLSKNISANKNLTLKLEAREAAVNTALKNLPQAGQIASRLVENLHGLTQPEIQKFWPRFWEKAPTFINGIKTEVKAELAAEHQQNRQNTREAGHSKGR